MLKKSHSLSPNFIHVDRSVEISGRQQKCMEVSNIVIVSESNT